MEDMIYFIYSKISDKKQNKYCKTLNKINTYEYVFYNGRWCRYTHKVKGKDKLESLTNTITDSVIVAKFNETDRIDTMSR